MMKDILSRMFKSVEKNDFDNYTDEFFLNDRLPPKSEIVNFQSNPMWKYIYDTIAYRIRATRDDLEDQNADIDVVRINQGRVEELRFIMSLPNFVLTEYENLVAEYAATRMAKEPNK